MVGLCVSQTLYPLPHPWLRKRKGSMENFTPRLESFFQLNVILPRLDTICKHQGRQQQSRLCDWLHQGSCYQSTLRDRPAICTQFSILIFSSSCRITNLGSRKPEKTRRRTPDFRSMISRNEINSYLLSSPDLAIYISSLSHTGTYQDVGFQKSFCRYDSLSCDFSIEKKFCKTNHV